MYDNHIFAVKNDFEISYDKNKIEINALKEISEKHHPFFDFPPLEKRKKMEIICWKKEISDKNDSKIPDTLIQKASFEFNAFLYKKFFTHFQKEISKDCSSKEADSTNLLFQDWLGQPFGLFHNSETMQNQRLESHYFITVILTVSREHLKTSWLTIESIFRQKLKANRVILWINHADDENQNIPAFLKILTRRGLEIRFCKNPHDKFFSLLSKDQDDCKEKLIVTAGENLIYKEDWIVNLYEAYLKEQKQIHCCTLFQINDAFANQLFAFGATLKENSLYYRIKEQEILNLKKFHYIKTKFGAIFSLSHLKSCLNQNNVKKELNLLYVSSKIPTEEDLWFSLIIYKCQLTLHKIMIDATNLPFTYVQEDESTIPCWALYQNIRLLKRCWKFFDVDLLNYKKNQIQKKSCFKDALKEQGFEQLTQTHSPIQPLMSNSLVLNNEFRLKSCIKEFDFLRYKEFFVRDKTKKYKNNKSERKALFQDWIEQPFGIISFSSTTEKKKVENVHPITVSLTSWKPRLKTCWLTIESIFQQTLKPNRVILWIDENEKNLVHVSLEILKRRGLEIRFCKNFRSYKKFFPLLSESIELQSHDLFIIADDDIVYNPNWIAELYFAYLKKPKQIHCYSLYQVNDEAANQLFSFKPLSKDMSLYRSIDNDFTSDPKKFYRVCTGHGVIFELEHFKKNLYEKELDVEYACTVAPTEDDLWFGSLVYKNDLILHKVGSDKPFSFLVEHEQISALQSSNSLYQNIRCLKRCWTYYKIKLLK
jgi:hypothetical protein